MKNLYLSHRLAPKIFSIGFNIVKKFLDEYTLSKINIYNHNKNKWLPAILERIEPKYLPKYFGGELTGPDGDPKCKDKITWGGNILIFIQIFFKHI